MAKLFWDIEGSNCVLKYPTLVTDYLLKNYSPLKELDVSDFSVVKKRAYNKKLNDLHRQSNGVFLEASMDLAVFIRNEKYWFQYSSLVNEFGWSLMAFCAKMEALGVAILPEENDVNWAFHQLVKMRLELDVHMGIAINENTIEMLSLMDRNKRMGYRDLLRSKEMSKKMRKIT